MNQIELNRDHCSNKLNGLLTRSKVNCLVYANILQQSACTLPVLSISFSSRTGKRRHSSLAASVNLSVANPNSPFFLWTEQVLGEYSTLWTLCLLHHESQNTDHYSLDPKAMTSGFPKKCEAIKGLPLKLKGKCHYNKLTLHYWKQFLCSKMYSLIWKYRY